VPEWSPQEDWALQDQVPAYSAGTGADTATFWSALAANVPALSARGSTELEARAAQLAVDGGAQPALLEAWERLADGRYAGSADGRPVWLTVSLEGRLPSDPREAPGYIEALGGRIYELGAPGTAGQRGAGLAPPPPPPPPAAVDAQGGGGMPVPLAAAAAAVLVAGGLGFGVAGTLNVPPPPPPPPPTQKVVFLAPPRQAIPRTSAEGDGSSRALAPAPLTLGEQRERQENRVRSDEARLQMLESRLQGDKTRLNELKRVEIERGADSPGIKLGIFPASTGPSSAAP